MDGGDLQAAGSAGKTTAPCASNRDVFYCEKRRATLGASGFGGSGKGRLRPCIATASGRPSGAPCSPSLRESCSSGTTVYRFAVGSERGLLSGEGEAAPLRGRVVVGDSPWGRSLGSLCSRWEHRGAGARPGSTAGEHGAGARPGSLAAPGSGTAKMLAPGTVPVVWAELSLVSGHEQPSQGAHTRLTLRFPGQGQAMWLRPQPTPRQRLPLPRAQQSRSSSEGGNNQSGHWQQGAQARAGVLRGEALEVALGRGQPCEDSSVVWGRTFQGRHT